MKITDKELAVARFYLQVYRLSKGFPLGPNGEALLNKLNGLDLPSPYGPDEDDVEDVEM